jgi:phage repressor protein C with HTH and peptisase S24 domain
MNGLTDRIQKRLAAMGKSARAASLEAGLSDAFIRNILKGKSGSPSADNLAKLAPVLGTTEVWLLREQGPEQVDQSEFRERVQSVPAGEEFDPDPDFLEDPERVDAARRFERRRLEPGEVVEREVTAGMGSGGQVPVITVDGQIVDDVRAVWRLPVDFLHSELRSRESDVDFISVEGDSMIPTLLPGDRVLVNRTHNKPGDGLFVIFDGVGPSVKRLEIAKGSNPLRVRIKSDNPLHGTDEIEAGDLAVIGRVVCKVTRL